MARLDEATGVQDLSQKRDIITLSHREASDLIQQLVAQLAGVGHETGELILVQGGEPVKRYSFVVQDDPEEKKE